MPVSSHGRVPRAHLDPVHSAADAMAVFALQMSHPLQFETLVMFLDQNQCGSTLVTVSGTVDPNHVVDIAETMALSGSDNPDVDALVIATIRPGGGFVPADFELWAEISDAVDECGLIVLDWLIVGRHGTESACERTRTPSRWGVSGF